MQELILEKSHTFANYATKRFRILLIFRGINEFTLEEIHAFASYAIEHFHTVVISENTWKHILVLRSV